MTTELALLLVSALTVIALGLLPRRRSLRKITAAPIPEGWNIHLCAMLPYFQRLDANSRATFLRRVQVFLNDQRIQAISCTPDHLDHLFIAGTAVMMGWGFPGFRYPNTRDLLIYPKPFDEDFMFRDDGDRLGEMIDGGPIIFSLPALREAQTFDDAMDLAVHELAHLLDSLMSPDSNQFRSELDPRIDAFMADDSLTLAIATGRSPIGEYALENEAEFFAVSS